MEVHGREVLLSGDSRGSGAGWILYIGVARTEKVAWRRAISLEIGMED